MGTKKRNRLEVIRDILTVIKQKSGTIKPTHILYKSNLSYAMMEEYLGELLGKKFITEEIDAGHKRYSITEKGAQYLEKYRFIAEFSESFGLAD
jgi:predicted transcriptional regulator